MIRKPIIDFFSPPDSQKRMHRQTIIDRRPQIHWIAFCEINLYTTKNWTVSAFHFLISPLLPWRNFDPKLTDNSVTMPLPNSNELDEILNSDSEHEDFDVGARVASETAARAARAGVVVPQPPEGFQSYSLGQPSQTQDTLIPTQYSQETQRRQLLLSQLTTSQNSTTPAPGSEFEALERLVQEQLGTQTQYSQPTDASQSTVQRKNKRFQAKKAANSGRPSGAKGYTEEERMNFLDIIERRLPCSGSEWSLVANEHAETYPDTDRNVDSIKRQYQALLRRREPTGDPNCPPDVKKAKAIDRLLKAKQRAGDISEENGGPMAALAGMEIRDGVDDSARGDSARGDASLASNVTGTALVQKRSSPKGGNSASMIEQMISFQMMQSQKREEERVEDQKRHEQERIEDQKRREDERRCKAQERREQRLRDERREDMFLKLVTVGLTAFAGNRVDPSTILETLGSGKQKNDHSSDDEDEDQGDRQRKRRRGNPKDDRNYNNDSH